MKEFAKDFYKSRAWINCRAAYLSSRQYLCERCLKDGRYTPADTVHHIVKLTPNNIFDPEITLNWKNLMAVCRDCHAALHGSRRPRYRVDETGKITARPGPPVSF